MNTYTVPHSSVAGFLKEQVLREGRAPPGSCVAFYDFILGVTQHQSNSIPLVRSEAWLGMSKFANMSKTIRVINNLLKVNYGSQRGSFIAFKRVSSSL